MGFASLLARATPQPSLRRSPSSGRWELEVLPEADPQEWDGVARTLGGGLFHTYQYAQSIYGSTARERLFVRWRDDRGRCVACCPGAVQGSRIWPFSRLFLQAHLAGFPACERVENLSALLGALSAALAARGIMALTVDSFGAPAGCPGGDPAPFAQLGRAEFRLALVAPEDDLWGCLAGTRRTQIRRAGRAGLVLRKGHTRADVEQLGRLIGGSARRWGQSHGEAFETPGWEKLEGITRHLLTPGLATVYLAECEGAAVSGNLVGHYNGLAYNLLAGSAPEGFKVGAASWLYWEIIKDLKAQGAREFNLGGVAPDGDSPGNPARGLYDFKRDFGGRLVSCASPTYVLRPGRYRWYKLLQGLRGCSAATMFRRLLRPGARPVG